LSRLIPTRTLLPCGHDQKLHLSMQAFIGDFGVGCLRAVVSLEIQSVSRKWSEMPGSTFVVSYCFPEPSAFGKSRGPRVFLFEYAFTTSPKSKRMCLNLDKRHR
jgi:hypothetical protein